MTTVGVKGSNTPLNSIIRGYPKIAADFDPKAHKSGTPLTLSVRQIGDIVRLHSSPIVTDSKPSVAHIIQFFQVLELNRTIY